MQAYLNLLKLAKQESSSLLLQVHSFKPTRLKRYSKRLSRSKRPIKIHRLDRPERYFLHESPLVTSNPRLTFKLERIWIILSLLWLTYLYVYPRKVRIFSAYLSLSRPGRNLINERRRRCCFERQKRIYLYVHRCCCFGRIIHGWANIIFTLVEALKESRQKLSLIHI